jgi:hypothetical protein
MGKPHLMRARHRYLNLGERVIEMGSAMINPDNNLVSVAVDLTRLPADAIAEDQLADVLNVGREVDLLERVRRSKKKSEISLVLLRFQATRIGMNPLLFDIRTKLDFIEKKMIKIVDEDNIELLYNTTEEVYNYGLKRIKEIADEKQLLLLDILARGMIKPVPSDEFFDALSQFKKPYRQGLYDFVVINKILIPFTWRKTGYLVSHRIYKDEKKFQMALEVLEENQLATILEFLYNNPGNPMPVVGRHIKTNQVTLSLLGKYGIVEPIKLAVQGDAKDYLFNPMTTLARQDKDHFDLVKMTLANFRFGEYYSKKTRLYDLDRFLEYMLDHGYAGDAEAIGTDYRNLEDTQVLKVTKTTDKNYRFWILKKDVIEDVRNVLRGIIPIHSDKSVGNITSIDNLIQTRRQISVELAQASKLRIRQAIRDILEGIST